MARAGAGRYWLIWLGVVPVAVWAVIRGFGLERGFPLLELIVFTPYVALAALFLAGVAVALRNWPAAAIASIATVWLAAAVLPRAIGEGSAAASGPQLSVLSSNIHHGDADPHALLSLVDRFHVDLLSVQELTPSFARRLEAVGLTRELPESVLSIRRGASGAGLYSSLPLRRLPQPQDDPTPLRMPRAALRLRDGTRLRVVAVHPWPPTHSVELWRGALDSLPPAGAGAPWLLAGDFNATLDHAELRAVLDRGYQDAADATGKGLEPTWPVGRRLPPLITIDHVLVDRRLGVLDYEVEDVPGTDHRALFAAIAVP